MPGFIEDDCMIFRRNKSIEIGVEGEIPSYAYPAGAILVYPLIGSYGVNRTITGQEEDHTFTNEWSLSHLNIPIDGHLGWDESLWWTIQV